MFRVSLLFLSLVAALLIVALSASSASAKIAFEWKVKGAALASGQSREFTASAESTFDLKMTFGGAGLLLLSSKFKVAAGAKIFGGKPGTNEEAVEFTGVTVSKPANCEVESLPNPIVGTIRTTLLKGEIVEGQKSREPLILFTPKTGTIFAELRYVGASCPIINQEENFTGSILATPLPELKEVLSGLFDFEPSQGNTFLLSAGGAVETSGLSVAGNPGTLGGNALMTLVSDEVYGAF